MKTDKDVAIPGDLLSDQVDRAGDGTYVYEGKVYAQRYGIISDRDKISVISLRGKYIPAVGDIVIGKVVDFGFFSWNVDINSPYEAFLHVSEHPSRIELGEMQKHLRVGDLIITKVIKVDPTMKIDLTLNEDSRLNVIRDGRVVEITNTKLPRLIGRNGSMINMLKKECHCGIFVAQNGRVWVYGKNDEDIDLACRAVMKVEEEAHTSGLTDRIAVFLDEGGNQ